MLHAYICARRHSKCASNANHTAIFTERIQRPTIPNLIAAARRSVAPILAEMEALSQLDQCTEALASKSRASMTAGRTKSTS